ncbi:hypothetical protein ACTXM3_18430, partial [Glutamicibacter arilaitensis]|uniref:hypothetical protein n=1 Tax=Glutamicibacter arilaitensis TaxID=256701 RepID=UPI003FD5783B
FVGGPYTPKDSSKKQEKTGRSPGQQPAAPADARYTLETSLRGARVLSGTGTSWHNLVRV